MLRFDISSCETRLNLSFKDKYTDLRWTGNILFLLTTTASVLRDIVAHVWPVRLLFLPHCSVGHSSDVQSVWRDLGGSDTFPVSSVRTAGRLKVKRDEKSPRSGNQHTAGLTGNCFRGNLSHLLFKKKRQMGGALSSCACCSGFSFFNIATTWLALLSLWLAGACGQRRQSGRNVSSPFCEMIQVSEHLACLGVEFGVKIILNKLC